MPHATKGFVDILHNLWGRVAPTEFKQLLPDVASVTMDHSLRDTTEQLVDHNGLVFFRDTIKGLLNHMTAESIHAQVERVATD